MTRYSPFADLTLRAATPYLAMILLIVLVWRFA